jgi:hypothetical protein
VYGRVESRQRKTVILELWISKHGSKHWGKDRFQDIVVILAGVGEGEAESLDDCSADS